MIRIDNSSLIGGGQHLYTAIADAARDAMEVRFSGGAIVTCLLVLAIVSTFFACNSFVYRPGRDNHNPRPRSMVFVSITIKAF